MAEMIRARGFTLIEVLISLAITTFVAAAAYGGISAVLNGAEQLRATSDRTVEINRALTLLNRDLRQFVDRPVRDEYGEEQPGISGGPLAYFPLSLTRAGWHNTQELPRSDMQRVHYYLEDNALWRAYYPVIDRVTSTERLTVRLLDGVDSLELRFLRRSDPLNASAEGVVDTSAWERNWIVDRSGGGTTLVPPLALELRLELAQLGLLRRLYVLPQL